MVSVYIGCMDILYVYLCCGLRSIALNTHVVPIFVQSVLE